MIRFFKKEEENQLIERIAHWENKTSGEIRIHLESHLLTDVLSAAQGVFLDLGMQRTRDRNAVLILIAPKDKKFAIIGDEGIDQQVSDTYWQEIAGNMQNHFRNGDFVGGVLVAVDQVGRFLETYFPGNGESDNQLSDDISYR